MKNKSLKVIPYVVLVFLLPWFLSGCGQKSQPTPEQESVPSKEIVAESDNSSDEEGLANKMAQEAAKKLLDGQEAKHKEIVEEMDKALDEAMAEADKPGEEAAPPAEDPSVDYHNIYFDSGAKAAEAFGERLRVGKKFKAINLLVNLQHSNITKENYPALCEHFVEFLSGKLAKIEKTNRKDTELLDSLMDETEMYEYDALQSCAGDKAFETKLFKTLTHNQGSDGGYGIAINWLIGPRANLLDPELLRSVCKGAEANIKDAKENNAVISAVKVGKALPALCDESIRQSISAQICEISAAHAADIKGEIERGDILGIVMDGYIPALAGLPANCEATELKALVCKQGTGEINTSVEEGNVSAALELMKSLSPHCSMEEFMEEICLAGGAQAVKLAEEGEIESAFELLSNLSECSMESSLRQICAAGEKEAVGLATEGEVGAAVAALKKLPDTCEQSTGLIQVCAAGANLAVDIAKEGEVAGAFESLNELPASCNKSAGMKNICAAAVKEAVSMAKEGETEYAIKSLKELPGACDSSAGFKKVCAAAVKEAVSMAKEGETEYAIKSLKELPEACETSGGMKKVCAAAMKEASDMTREGEVSYAFELLKELSDDCNTKKAIQDTCKKAFKQIERDMREGYSVSGLIDSLSDSCDQKKKQALKNKSK